MIEKKRAGWRDFNCNDTKHAQFSETHILSLDFLLQGHASRCSSSFAAFTCFLSSAFGVFNVLNLLKTLLVLRVTPDTFGLRVGGFWGCLIKHYSDHDLGIELKLENINFNFN